LFRLHERDGLRTTRTGTALAEADKEHSSEVAVPSANIAMLTISVGSARTIPLVAMSDPQPSYSSSKIAPWLLRAVEWHPALMGTAPIPSQFHDAVIAKVPHKALRQCILRYGAAFWTEASLGKAPLLLGSPAMYKSYAAAALSRALHSRANIHVGWCDVPITLNQLERKRFDRATDDMIDQWKLVPFLVIDDFGMAKLDTWQFSVLAEIAMARFDAGRPTCWTGNIDVEGEPSPAKVEEALRRGVGTQLTRRILERSEGYRVYVR